MSYCRCDGDSNVYIYMHISGGLTIHFCLGMEGIQELLKKYNLKDTYNFVSREEAITFLNKIKDLSFLIPERVFERLQMETW